ncbi:MAG: MerR family transcriptional regulator, copper efflux regulator, partial [bacterium]
MDALTIHEAAETTGWSPRMLRYIERIGLVEAPRSESGYRLYGAAQLQRLRVGVLATDRHQAGHLVLGEGDLVPAVRGEREVGDLEVVL